MRRINSHLLNSQNLLFLYFNDDNTTVTTTVISARIKWENVLVYFDLFDEANAFSI